MFDAKKVAAGLLAVVRDWVEPAVKAMAGRLDDYEQRLAKSVHGLESAERRLSRHAEHLAAVETRLKSLERLNP